MKQAKATFLLRGLKMDTFLEEDMEILAKLKHELKEEDDKLKFLLNKKRVSNYELDNFFA